MKTQKITKLEALYTIKDYINKHYVFDNTGDIWWHNPGLLSVKFYKPEILINHLSTNYSDEMMFSLECINNDYEWIKEDLIPFAAVSSCVEIDPEEQKEFILHGVDPFLHNAFGYLFFELSTGNVITTHSDGWSLDNKPYTIKGLIKEMGIKIVQPKTAL